MSKKPTDTMSILTQLKQCHQQLPAGEWTYAIMGAVWVGALQDNDRYIAKGATKDAYSLFEIDPLDLPGMDEDEAEELAQRTMRAIVELRNLLPAIIKIVENV